MLWNARKLKNKKEEIIQRIQDFDIAIVTELQNKANEKYNIPGFNVVIKDSKRINRIAAIMVKKDIKIKEIENVKSNNSNIEVLGVQIMGLEKELNVLAFYRRPGEIVERGSWKRIIEKVGQGKNVLCIADFNAHNQL